jgi:hypothetical protein
MFHKDLNISCGSYKKKVGLVMLTDTVLICSMFPGFLLVSKVREISLALASCIEW